jgi:hypothetical protein
MKFTLPKCDHSIGYLYDYAHQQEIRASNTSSLTKFNIDGRHCCMRKFKYCPDCGAGIDWIAIRKTLTNN